MTHHDLAQQIKKATYGALLIGAVVGLVYFLLSLIGCAPTGQMGGDPTPGMMKKEVQQYKSRYPGLSTRTIQALKSGYVYIGMDAAHVEAAIGRPSTINETRAAGTVEYQYVYRVASGQSSYVYIENGKVTAVQEGGAGVTAGSS